MEFISVFDVFKIGVGPSSSHTLGPWKAALRFIESCTKAGFIANNTQISVSLYGSLSLTGKGHATDLAVMLGLSGADPEYIPVESIDVIISAIKNKKEIFLGNEILIPFNIDTDIVFNRDFLPFHANGLKFTVYTSDTKYESIFFSIGGGFVVKEETENSTSSEEKTSTFPYPIDNASELLAYCTKENKKVWEIVYENEKSLRSETEIHNELMRIWDTMLECMYIGCHTEGTLPGGLNVRRRA